ncbi:MAG: SAM-dependent methyltransferase [Gammaproteobacteria bacterium]|nr:MAG: SAM-dependent methyltransferase [Gammaproteobacteria bacterium]
MVEPLIKSDIQTLAEPDNEAKRRSQLLTQLIKKKCDQADGRIRFSEYMDTALYQPGLGYYNGGLQKFGHEGDFITAPEVSPLFGQCLAGQVAEVLQNFRKDSDEKLFVLEFGAGSGVLAVDILLQLEKLDSLPEKYLILELSVDLQCRQKETIRRRASHLFDRVQWLDQLPDDVLNAVVIANEVFDAMPVECFRINKNEVETLMVSVENEKFISSYVADSRAGDRIKSIKERSEIEFTDGYSSEFNPAIHGWLLALEGKIKRVVILLIDYGYNEKEYYHPDRTAGTLMCYYRHKAHGDYFWWPGLQDITAFVNFTEVAYSAVDSGLEVLGYTTQAAFLLANGLPDLHASQVTDDVRQQIKLSQQIKTLTLPSEMGDRFKVMALTKNYDESLKGFSMLDLRNRL